MFVKSSFLEAAATNQQKKSNRVDRVHEIHGVTASTRGRYLEEVPINTHLPYSRDWCEGTSKSRTP